MAGNSFGTLFRITTFGESHGTAIGVVIDGCPARVPLDAALVQSELKRRRPGQSDVTSPRDEPDEVTIISGMFEGETTGAPLTLLVHNRDARSEEYLPLKDIFRPSHADFTYHAKFGVRDFRGGGRASARETVARVAAGAVAKAVLAVLCPSYRALAFVEQIGGVTAQIDQAALSTEAIEQSPVRCPDVQASKRMVELVHQVKEEGDSLGGVVGGVIRGLPPGLGEPVFDRFQADLGKALLSLPAVKGFEVGEGFRAASMRGSEHNDPFTVGPAGEPRPASNHAGGVLGGITTGEDILFRIAFKPTSTIRREQTTVTAAGAQVTLAATGRHDPCVLPRAVPIVEAMAHLVTLDHLLRFRAITLVSSRMVF